MNPLDAYFINQSHNPGKLTFVNASFWEKRTAIHKPRRPFNFDLKTYPSRTILREVSRVSSLILRAKPWLAKKVLRHGNRFVARVRRRYFRRERSDDRKCVCCSQARPEPMFLALVMVLNRVFWQEFFNRFLWFMESLIKNGRTLRKCCLFSSRYKNVWDIGTCLKPRFKKNGNNFKTLRQIFL